MPDSRPISIIIPAAGIGKKMKSYDPKSLIQLNDIYTVISWQIKILKKCYPSAEIIVVVGHQADMIIKHIRFGSNKNIKIVENELYESTNVVRSISMGLRVASYSRLLIVYGDLVFNDHAIDIINNGNRSIVLVDRHSRLSNEEVGVNIIDNRVMRMDYDLPTKWAQVIYLTGRELDIFQETVWNRNHSRWFGFEAINKVLSSGGIIRAIEPRLTQIAEIDTVKDIEKAKRIIR